MVARLPSGEVIGIELHNTGLANCCRQKEHVSILAKTFPICCYLFHTHHIEFADIINMGWSTYILNHLSVRRISTFGYMITSLIMAAGPRKKKSAFSSLLRPYYFGPLFLSHQTKRDGKGTS